MTPPRVSIVVPTLGRAEHLAACLDAIAATVDIAHEVICVTVAGDEPTDAVLARREVEVIREEQRGGFVRAANAGFRLAQGEYVLQLNDDCLLLPHSVANAVRFLEAPAHEAIGQAAFFHDTHVMRNVFAQIECDGRRFRVLHVRGLCYASFGLVRRELGQRLGWYDERYYMYGADPDFSLKVWYEAGLEVRPCPGALVQHHALDDDRGRVERLRQGEDNAKLFEKWGLGS